ncbi:MAG TPA: DUF4129 domain-containing protein [Herpetosiphonaceae bacterium]|nr:DUF4129 domain-containing protein [Herpetosiphonaceae bacterium]
MATLRRILLVLVLVGVLPWPAQAQSATPTLEEYAQMMREAFAAAQRNDEIGLREAADRLLAVRSVIAADETELPANNQWLADELAKKNPNFQSIEERLGAHVEVLTNARTARPEDLERLRAILNAPPFAEQATPEPPVSSSSGNFFDWLFDPSEFITTCFTILAIIVVTGVVGYTVLAIRGGMKREARRPAPAGGDSEERNLSSVKAIQRADEVAVEGDFRKGVRYLYLSTLLWLEERGVLRYDRTLTNREVLEAVPVGSPLRGRLTPVVQTFDRVWYGFDEIDQTAFDAFRQQVAHLREGR